MLVALSPIVLAVAVLGVPAARPTTTKATSTTTSAPACTPSPLAYLWAQCGGVSFTGPTLCAGTAICTYLNPWYSQCLPGPVTTPSGASSALGTTSSSSGNPTQYTCINSATVSAPTSSSTKPPYPY